VIKSTNATYTTNWVPSSK